VPVAEDSTLRTEVAIVYDPGRRQFRISLPAEPKPLIEYVDAQPRLFGEDAAKLEAFVRELRRRGALRANVTWTRDGARATVTAIEP
jgi:hypothetical protein